MSTLNRSWQTDGRTDGPAHSVWLNRLRIYTTVDNTPWSPRRAAPRRLPSRETASSSRHGQRAVWADAAKPSRWTEATTRKSRTFATRVTSVDLLLLGRHQPDRRSGGSPADVVSLRRLSRASWLHTTPTWNDIRWRDLPDRQIDRPFSLQRDPARTVEVHAEELRTPIESPIWGDSESCKFSNTCCTIGDYKVTLKWNYG